MTIPCDREDCVLEYRGGSTTCMGYTPVYDKNGNQLNHDPNITTAEMYCRTCDTRWTETRKHDEITYDK